MRGNYFRQRSPHTLQKPEVLPNAGIRRLSCTSYWFLRTSDDADFLLQRSVRCLIFSKADSVFDFTMQLATDKVTLLTDGRDIYAKTVSGDFYNLLGEPNQPLLVLGKEDTLKALSSRISRRRRKSKSKRVKKRKKTVASRED